MAYKFKTYGRAPQLAYKALDLVDPANRHSEPDQFLDLGTFSIIENEATVSAVVDDYIKELADVSRLISQEYEAVSEDADWPRKEGLIKKRNEVERQFRRRCVLNVSAALAPPSAI